MNAKLVIKPLMNRSSQGWNQFRITEPASVADSDRKVVTSESRDRRLGKIGYQRSFCGAKSRLPAFKSHRNTLNRVVPFHCAILVEESRRRGSEILLEFFEEERAREEP